MHSTLSTIRGTSKYTRAKFLQRVKTTLAQRVATSTQGVGPKNAYISSMRKSWHTQGWSKPVLLTRCTINYEGSDYTLLPRYACMT